MDRYTPEPMPAGTSSAPVAGGDAQRFVADRDVPGKWWTSFGSSALDELIAEALRNNPDLAAAQAALRQAHELTLAGETALFPIVQGNAAASRNKTPTGTLSPATATGNPYYSLYTGQLSVSYVPDVFGGTRRQIEELAAAEEQQRFQLEAVYLTLTANIVVAAITEAEVREEIAATEESISTQREALTILRRQHELGQAAGTDVAAQEAALAQAEAALPPLQKQLQQQRHLLAVLTGHPPSEAQRDLFDLATLQLPREVPVSLPSSLVEHRPDIRVAEAQLHAASAAIGIAIANMLPQITLSGNLGASALTIGQLFAPGTGFWTISASTAQTIFDAGALLHRKRAAEAAFDEAAAQYRSTVLSAFQNVADTLRALDVDADALRAAAVAEGAARDSLTIVKRQLALGAVNGLALLNAEQAHALARLNLIVARASRLADTVALFQALGGGWWRREQ